VGYKEEQAQRKAWLDGLKPGDEVIAEVFGSWRHHDTVQTVARRSAAMILLAPRGASDKDTRIRAEDGKILGGSGRIRPITDADREAFERAALVSKICRWTECVSREPRKASIDTLRAVAAALDTERR